MGITPTGYEADTLETVIARLEARIRALTGIPTLDVRDPNGLIANIFLPAAEEIASLHALAELVYNAPDPRRSTDQSYAIVAALRGVARKEASIGKHPGISFVFSALVTGTIARGAVRFYPQGQPENVWINSDALTIPAGGTYLIAVESELAGASKILLAGSTIVKAAAPAQLTSITVATNATQGTDIELESTWRQRSDLAIRDEQTKVGAKLEAIAGVVAARIVETPGFINAIIDDNAGAVANDVIAQTIFDSKAQGVLTTGALTGTAINVVGESIPVYFDRVVVLRAYAAVTVRAPNNVSQAALKAAMRAEQPKQSGLPLVWSKLNKAAAATEGVLDVTALTIGFTAGPTASVNLLASPIQRIDLAVADIAVTVTA